MKIIHSDRQKGLVKILLDRPEDIWNCYNLILPGDHLESSTFRRIQTETAGGQKDSDRIRITLRLKIEAVDVDLTVGIIRCKGKNCTESPHLKLGAYHSIDLPIGQTFKLWKEEWDSVAWQQLQSFANIKDRAECAALLLEEGHANIYLLLDSSTNLLTSIGVTIPKKRRSCPSSHISKAIERFWKAVEDAVRRNLDFEVLKVLIVGGSVFVREEFFKRNAWLAGNKKILSIPSSSSIGTAGLQEILSRPQVAAQIADTRYALQSKVIGMFLATLSRTPYRAFYGNSQVHSAAESGAISHLLLTDAMLRSTEIGQRKKYVALVECVRRSGGEVYIFSSAHPTGQQLEMLCGVAAILKWEMPELEEQD